MKNSLKSLRALSRAMVALCILTSAFVFYGCSQYPEIPEHNSSLVYPNSSYAGGNTYTINGVTVTDDYWKEFVQINFTAINGKKFGLTTDGAYANKENLWFTIKADGTLYYTYASSWSTYSGTILGVDDSIRSADNGFVLLLKTDNNHTNWTAGSCNGAPSEFDDTSAHTCYLPVYFAITNNTMKNGAYYSAPTACFYTKAGALGNMAYDSGIYGGAATYPAR